MQSAVAKPAVEATRKYLVALQHGGHFFFANYSKRTSGGLKRKPGKRLEWRHSPFDASVFTLLAAEEIANSTPGAVVIVERAASLAAFQRGYAQ